MKDSLQAGLDVEFRYTVPVEKTVPYLLPESPEFSAMPRVFATGFLVGLVEWACIRTVNPHLDWPREQTVGTGIFLTHSAATPPGLTVTVTGKLESVEGKKLTFSIQCHDGVDIISHGTHERFVIDEARFSSRTAAKCE